jgi:hypothetical protein
MEQLAERRLVQPVQDVDELRIVCTVMCEAWTGMSQDRDERIAMLAGNLPVLTAVAVVETRLFHGYPHMRTRKRWAARAVPGQLGGPHFH